MIEPPVPDFLITARDECDDYESDPVMAERHRGIWRVKLNAALSVCLVPDVQWRGEDAVVPAVWTPPDAHTARRWTLATARYSVTPSADWAGRTYRRKRVMAGEGFGFTSAADEGVTVFVHAHEFDALTEDARLIRDDWNAKHDRMRSRRSVLDDRPLARFIVERLMGGGVLSPHAFAMVGR